MPQVIADRRDLEFVLYEQMEIETLLKYEKYADLNRKMFDMIISEARNFAVKELLPTFAEGDKIGLIGKNGVGKTTVLKLILGREEPTEGTIDIEKEYKTGYFSQSSELNETDNILGILEQLFSDIRHVPGFL